MNIVLALSGVVIKELYRRKDFYVLFVMVALITLLMGSVNFFDDDRIVRYLKEICLNLIWISSLVIAITTTGRQIPAEKESRTIFPLLAKPVSRAQLIVGKFLGCWLACGLALVAFYLFFGVISGAKEHLIPGASYLQALWLHWVCLAVIIALALFGSVVFSAPSVTATICFIGVLGILFVGGHLGKVAVDVGGGAGTVLYALYYAIPHLEWFDVSTRIVHNHPAIDWLSIGGASLYGVAYTGFLLGATWMVFRRKSLA